MPGNFLEIPFITPYFGVVDAIQNTGICSDHTTSQLGWYMYENSEITDNPNFGSIVTNKVSDTRTEYTIRMIDGVPEGEECNQVFFLKFRPGCPSVKKRTLQGTITGTIETRNAGYEMLFIDIAPPYLTNINDLNTENWTNPTLSPQYTTYYNRHPVLGYRNHIGIPQTGYSSKRLLLECTHSSGFTLANTTHENPTTGYRIESQDWEDPTDWEDPAVTESELENGSDSITATIKSDHPEDSGDIIEIRNSDSCPGYICITAQTIDGSWQVDGNIFYQINLIIDEINN